MTTSGGLGEAEGGGPSLNIVPKEGGNSVRGSFYAAGVTEGMIGSNYTEELRDRGLTTPGETRKVWDFNLGVGGPIKKDRAVVLRHVPRRGQRAHACPGMFANANAGDPTKWTYVADHDPAGGQRRVVPHDVAAPDRAGHAAQQVRGLLGRAEAVRGRRRGRLLGQRLPHVRRRPRLRRIDGRADAVGIGDARAGNRRVSRLRQSRASRPSGRRRSPTGCCSKPASAPTAAGGAAKQMPGLDTHDLIRVVEQCAAGCAANGNIPGLTYRSGNWSSNINWNTQWNAAASLVTGSHSMKFGYQGALLYDDRKNFTNSRVPAVPRQQRRAGSDDA